MLNPETAVVSFKQQTELSLRGRCLTEYPGSELREVLERSLRVVFRITADCSQITLVAMIKRYQQIVTAWDMLDLYMEFDSA